MESIEQLLKCLGQNRVTMPISTNKFEESFMGGGGNTSQQQGNPFAVFDTFKDIFDPVEFFRTMKNNGTTQTFSRSVSTNSSAQPPAAKPITHNVNPLPIKKRGIASWVPNPIPQPPAAKPITHNVNPLPIKKRGIASWVPNPIPSVVATTAKKTVGGADNGNSAINSLYAVLAHVTDESLSLFPDQAKEEKVVQFKNLVIKDFPIRYKEIGLSRSKIAPESLHDNVDNIITVISHMFKLNVFLKYTDDAEQADHTSNKLYKYHGKNHGKKEVAASNEVVVTVEKTRDGMYTRGEDADLKACYTILCQGIESKLVKVVREIASIIDVPIYDTEKKLLGKKELLESIRALGY